jgi:virulence-associated protein VagC
VLQLQAIADPFVFPLNFDNVCILPLENHLICQPVAMPGDSRCARVSWAQSRRACRDGRTPCWCGENVGR